MGVSTCSVMRVVESVQAVEALADGVHTDTTLVEIFIRMSGILIRIMSAERASKQKLTTVARESGETRRNGLFDGRAAVDRSVPDLIGNGIFATTEIQQ